MKAIYLKNRGNSDQAFELKEVPDPSPQDNEVLISVEAFGLNFADVMARLGLYKDAPPMPCILGYEVCGKIQKVGKKINDFNIGDRVVALTRFGGYATMAIAQEGAVVKISDEMEASAACSLATQFATAYYCAEEVVRLHKGDHVLIQAAAGGVGTALVQLAKRKGCIVFGTAGSAEKIEHLKKLGVDYPINYRKDDFYKVINNQLGKNKIDVVFDSLGGKSFRKGLKLLNSGGRIVGLGAAEMASSKSALVKAIKAMVSFGIYHPAFLLMNSKSIIGVNMLAIADNNQKILERCLKEVTKLVESGELKTFVGGRFSSQEISKAHDFLGERKSIGKVAVTWDS